MIKGFGQIKESMDKTAQIFKMKSGESKAIRFILPSTEYDAAWEHVENFGGFWKTVECLGKKICPLCKAGKTASFKTYIPILDKTDDKVKIFKASKDVVKQLIGLEAEYGDITKRETKISRHGEGLSTQYQFFAKDIKIEDFSKYIEMIPPTENLISQLTKEEIQALMDNMGSGEPPEDVALEHPF